MRLRAATEAAQYMHPKLGAVATLSINGDDFASRLDRAIERSGSALRQIADQSEVEPAAYSPRQL